MRQYHGYRYHKLYKIWISIKHRCYNKNDYHYKDYGGRGIQVCDEWMNPKTFIEWCLKNGWKEGLYIDRKNNNENYEPNNCRFITPQQSACNTRLLYRNNSSGYRGVYFDKIKRKWKAQISINLKRKSLGYFNTAIEAAIAYDNKAKNLNDGRPLNLRDGRAW